MSPIQWAVRPLRKYADFSGRAPRAEYWWFTLASGVAAILLGFVDDAVSEPVMGIYGPISLLLTVALFVPSLAVLVRRLHDIDRTGWWALLDVGSYVLVVGGLLTPDPQRLYNPFQAMSPIVMLAVVLMWTISAVVLLVFMITSGTDGPNEYGSDPYGSSKPDEGFA